jgi:DNA-binding transcriptional regulator YbjK
MNRCRVFLSARWQGLAVRGVRPGFRGCLDRLACIEIRRTRDPIQRRLELCDAAIEILGESGAKGLSHVKVDSRARVPKGTTSTYFRTRSSLLHAVAERLAERDYATLQSVGMGSGRAEEGNPHQGPSELANLLVAMATEPFRTQVKARYELFMLATREPEVAALFQRNIGIEFAFLRDLVRQLQDSVGIAADDTLEEEQALAVMALISGITLTLVAGDPSFRDPAKIDRFLLATVTGMRIVHEEASTRRSGLEAGADSAFWQR